MIIDIQSQVLIPTKYLCVGAGVTFAEARSSTKRRLSQPLIAWEMMPLTTELLQVRRDKEGGNVNKDFMQKNYSLTVQCVTSRMRMFSVTQFIQHFKNLSQEI